ncbi:hypothetical protein EMPG_13468 [Blastomyces silverae]|uniref:Uncharacterized protein n=1 Tax=Blastomyces silverae TaxID=2060906 RepID=A0A0H1BI69_9EURO|nr:hypothetical protein EMPG_13468 [Blastomyces silverae]
MISPLPSANSGQRVSLDSGQKQGLNTTQASNTANKGRVPVSPGMGQVRRWESL